MKKIVPFLWLNKGDAKKAAEYYKKIFGGKIIGRPEIYNDTPSGKVDVYTVDIFNQRFILMGAGPEFTFNESISFTINCKNQAEIDYYWKKLTTNGGRESQCGWLKDKFGVSWQIVPIQLNKLMTKENAPRIMQAMYKMKKIIIGDLVLASKKTN